MLKISPTSCNVFGPLDDSIIVQFRDFGKSSHNLHALFPHATLHSLCAEKHVTPFIVSFIMFNLMNIAPNTIKMQDVLYVQNGVNSE